MPFTCGSAGLFCPSCISNRMLCILGRRGLRTPDLRFQSRQRVLVFFFACLRTSIRCIAARRYFSAPRVIFFQIAQQTFADSYGTPPRSLVPQAAAELCYVAQVGAID